MRGNPDPTQAGIIVDWSIPAYAGEPSQLRITPCDPRVYPRVCGGTHRRRNPGRERGGLSPRMRGNLDDIKQLAYPFRSIPAYAGEPKKCGHRWIARTVYPRVCGGTLWLGDCPRADGGLSPRMRGNPGRPAPAYRRERSIPAYAGEPVHIPSAIVPAWVYPRVCGGTGKAGVIPNAGGGLSPRMRGNRRQRVFICSPAGSIPAYAGEPNAGRKPAGV